MANFKKELKAIMARFDAAQEAFAEGSQKHDKRTKKLKSAKAKIKSLKQKVASLEQELKLAQSSSAAPSASEATDTKPKRKSKAAKSTGARRSRTPSPTGSSSAVSAEEMAEAVSDAPDSVSEAAAEKPATKARRARPRKTTGEAKATRKAASREKSTNPTGRPGRPSTKGPASVLTQIPGVGATMAARFEEAGVNSVDQFANLSDDDMKEVLIKCGPRYRSADSARMEGYREAAREVTAS